ncbi:glycoside hydrolase family 2 immunoglobulin domain protein beta-sandwich [Beutenbergia cavernae DSM 12333]|uniref:Glycoside hydrolase family 2 immunoglobulin domain protein beta-sandwich n=1 Tax=Beutenbergia cavernae (strain ATCC BAA-8 / DSM 12333 / CCUG 43141 / JCM 11478 / NBRC 16432 / NCIMB 13614 / HKI 0122) TaxID=471853 RepID=C5C2M9_BEUC1|nr:glycoside hydrolase [Beutenbergia cavernae]ACQ79715.1 glycoside hydrolase family 2 immunoglobulin domain protein beta-sandwich [Beutenbergia cavernae DSM 12333]
MHEIIDLDAPAHIRNHAELAAEVERLLASLGDIGDVGPSPAGRAVLTGWTARDVEHRPAAPASVPDDELFPVSLPHTVEAAFVHLRCRVPADLVAGERPVLCVGAADYEAWVYVDGVLRAEHSGYFAPFDVALTAADRSGFQLDIVTRRARESFRWTGESEAPNHGDAHGKGLGSVCGDAVAAGAGLLQPVWIEHRPATRIAQHRVVAGADGVVRVEVDLESADSEDPAPGALHLLAEILEGDDVVGSSAVTAARQGRTVLDVSVVDPHPWSPADPHLYRLRLAVVVDGELRDEVSGAVGLRTIERRDDGSLLLNGAPLYLRGTTTIGCFWDAAWSGDADAVLRQLLVVKALFGNTIRVHVSVLPDLFYACADRVGILVYQDAPLQWHCFEPRKDDLDAELDQIRELAVGIRNHPSVALVSVPNEMHMDIPFHDSDLEFVARAHAVLESDGPQAVLLQDWGGEGRARVAHQALHDYPGYFHHTPEAGSGVTDWGGARLDPGVRAIVSEYGGGAVPSWEAMLQSRAAAERRGEPFTLPDTPDGPWTAEEGVFAQTGELLDNHQRMVGWQPSFAAYHAASQAVQARVLTAQTGRIRRDRARTSGVIHHYLQNPAPHFYNPWVDLHVIDSAGHLTGGFDALREAMRPVALDVLGLPYRAYADSDLRAELWVYSDLAVATVGRLVWSWSADGHVVDAGTTDLTIGADSSTLVVELALRAPSAGGGARLSVALEIEDVRWTESEVTVGVHNQPETLPEPVAVLGDVAGFAERTASWLPNVETFSTAGEATSVVVTPDVALEDEVVAQLRAFARTGGRVVLLERSAADDLRWVSRRIPVGVAVNQIDGLASVDMSMVSTGLTSEDLSRWATPDGRVIDAPLVSTDRRGAPIWARSGHRLQLAALQEFDQEPGTVFLCQLLVWSTLGREPSAARVLRALLTTPYRPL